MKIEWNSVVAGVIGGIVVLIICWIVNWLKPRIFKPLKICKALPGPIRDNIVFSLYKNSDKPISLCAKLFKRGKWGRWRFIANYGDYHPQLHNGNLGLTLCDISLQSTPQLILQQNGPTADLEITQKSFNVMTSSPMMNDTKLKIIFYDGTQQIGKFCIPENFWDNGSFFTETWFPSEV